MNHTWLLGWKIVSQTGLKQLIGLHQGSVLNLRMFVIVTDVISTEIRGDLTLELLYADEFELLAENQEL
jgi:hypothetical protein